MRKELLTLFAAGVAFCTLPGCGSGKSAKMEKDNIHVMVKDNKGIADFAYDPATYAYDMRQWNPADSSVKEEKDVFASFLGPNMTHTDWDKKTATPWVKQSAAEHAEYYALVKPTLKLSK